MRVFLWFGFLLSLVACGDRPAAFKEVEPNDTPGEAKSVGTPTLTDPILLRAAIVPAGDLDLFPFTVSAVADVRLQTFDRSGVGCDGVDTILELLDQNGSTILAENDDETPPENTCSLIDATTSPGAQRLAPGDYFAKVTAINETVQIQSYRLQISLLSLCGDGVKQEGREACDDGNTLSGDGCRADCTSEVCGDGVVDAGEDCDDQNLLDADACLNGCQAAACGDGVLFDGAEECDDGNTINGDGCGDACRSEFCGSGILDPQEACDDGNLLDGDGCRGDCLKIELCGDGLEDANEQCDDGNLLDGDGCRSDCTDEVCGDGVADPQEECDDNNATSGDGCRADCQLEAGHFFEVEPNDVVGANVKDIPLQDVLVHAEINPIGDSDLFEFTLSATTTITFETFDEGGPGPQPEGCLGIDTELLLFARDPNTGAMEIALNAQQLPIGDDDAGVLSCSLLSLTLSPNLYQLRVSEFGGDASIAYTMQVTIP